MFFSANRVTFDSVILRLFPLFRLNLLYWQEVIFPSNRVNLKALIVLINTKVSFLQYALRYVQNVNVNYYILELTTVFQHLIMPPQNDIKVIIAIH